MHKFSYILVCVHNSENIYIYIYIFDMFTQRWGRGIRTCDLGFIKRDLQSIELPLVLLKRNSENIFYKLTNVLLKTHCGLVSKSNILVCLLCLSKRLHIIPLITLQNNSNQPNQTQHKLLVSKKHHYYQCLL
jgi:hypothetical protein